MSTTTTPEDVTPNLRHAGEPWSEDEDEALVQELRDGLTLKDVAELHGRTASAVGSRASRMVPDDQEHPTARQARIEFVREQLTTGDYDWRTPLRAGAGVTAWTTQQDQRLRDGWGSSTPMLELADELRRSEPMVARRLVQLGLATNLPEIVDRLGCDPRGPLAARAAIIRGATGPILHILIGLDDAGRPVHISLHESPKAARDLTDAMQGEDYGVDSWRTVARHIGGAGYTDPLVGFGL